MTALAVTMTESVELVRTISEVPFARSTTMPSFTSGARHIVLTLVSVRRTTSPNGTRRLDHRTRLTSCHGSLGLVFKNGDFHIVCKKVQCRHFVIEFQHLHANGLLWRPRLRFNCLTQGDNIDVPPTIQTGRRKDLLMLSTFNASLSESGKLISLRTYLSDEGERP